MAAFLGVPVAVAFLVAFVLRSRVSARLARLFGVFAAGNLLAAVVCVILSEQGITTSALSDPYQMLLIVTLLLLLGLCSLPFYIIPIRRLKQGGSGIRQV